MPAYVCPEHVVELADRGAALECPSGHAFEVRDGVARFVPGSSYAEQFGRQWVRFATTQLDSHTGLPLSRDRARRCLEPVWDELAGKAVLECGCGAGRFTEVLLGQGADVTSVDLSQAVDANAANFPPNGRHRVAQADIRALPFPQQSFDVVFCLGVIQHTPSPEATIAALFSRVRPGGWLAIDHYTHNLSNLTRVAQVARQVLKRLPDDRKLPAIERIVDTLLPLHRRYRRYGKVISRVSPVLSYYHVLPDLPEQLQRDFAVLDTHDSQTCFYKRRRSPRQIRRTLERLGAVDISVWRGGNGLEARARRGP